MPIASSNARFASAPPAAGAFVGTRGVIREGGAAPIAPRQRAR